MKITNSTFSGRSITSSRTHPQRIPRFSSPTRTGVRLTSTPPPRCRPKPPRGLNPQPLRRIRSRSAPPPVPTRLIPRRESTTAHRGGRRSMPRPTRHVRPVQRMAASGRRVRVARTSSRWSRRRPGTAQRTPGPCSTWSSTTPSCLAGPSSPRPSCPRPPPSCIASRA